MRLVLIGGTGLIGSLFADRFLARQRGELHAILRRPSGRRDARWREHVAPLSEWPRIAVRIEADVAISALGTTMRAAGSQAAFRAIDLDAVVAVAKAARGAGVRRLIGVSSAGADRGSRLFYPRIKAEMEDGLAGLGFDRLDIFRPGLLRGARDGDRRLGEWLGILISPFANLLLRGPLDRYAAIDASVVAAAMMSALEAAQSGVYVHENRAIHSLAHSQSTMCAT